MASRYYFAALRRFEQALNDLGLDLRHFGFTMKLSGVVFQGMGKTIVFMFPSAVVPHLGEMVQLTDEQAAALVKQTDQPEVLAEVTSEGVTANVWVRKLQYEVSGHVQQKVWWADGYKCQFCGRGLPHVQLTVDHFHPLDLGGVNDTSNYLTACKSCNKKKGNTPALEWCKNQGLDYNGFVDYLASRKMP